MYVMKHGNRKERITEGQFCSLNRLEEKLFEIGGKFTWIYSIAKLNALFIKKKTQTNRNLYSFFCLLVFQGQDTKKNTS